MIEKCGHGFVTGTCVHCARPEDAADFRKKWKPVPADKVKQRPPAPPETLYDEHADCRTNVQKITDSYHADLKEKRTTMLQQAHRIRELEHTVVGLEGALSITTRDFNAMQDELNYANARIKAINDLTDETVRGLESKLTNLNVALDSACDTLIAHQCDDSVVRVRAIARGSK